MGGLSASHGSICAILANRFNIVMTMPKSILRACSLILTLALSACIVESLDQDLQQLQMQQVTPASGASNVTPDQVVTVEFSDELDPAGLTADKVQLLDSESNPVAVTLASSGNKLFLTPSLPLVLTGSYKLWLSAELKGKNTLAMGEVKQSPFSVRDGIWSSPLQIAGTGTGKQIQWQHHAQGNKGNAILLWESRTVVNGVVTSNELYAAAFNAGSFGWLRPLVLQQNTGLITIPAQARVLNDNNAIAIWQRSDSSGSSQIIASRYLAQNDAWEASKLISAADGISSSPRLFLDQTGNLLATWLYKPSSSSTQQAYASRYLTTSNQWSTPLRPDSDNQSNSIVCCSVGSDKSGNLSVSWQASQSAAGKQAVWNRRYAASQQAWLAAEQISPAIPAINGETTIQLSGSGHAIVGWNGSTDGSNAYPLSAVQSSDSLRWGEVKSLSETAILAGLVSVNKDGNSGTWLSWVQNKQLFARKFDAASGEFLAATAGLALPNFLSASGMAQDGSGGAWLLWLDYKDSAYIGSASMVRLNKTGSFSTAAQFGDKNEFSGVSDLRLDAANGRAVVGWVDANGRILARHFH